MTSLSRVRVLGFVLISSAIALLLYLLTPAVSQAGSDATAELRFTWIYSELLVDETLLILSAMVLLVPQINHRFDSVLSRGFSLTRPVRYAATLALVGGTLFFAFWASLDILGGYSGPGYTLAKYPLTSSIYYDLGLDRLPVWDKQGVLGLSSFIVAALGFMTLRVRRSIRAAVKDGLTLFVAPVLALFELALWIGAPLDMYWAATTFVEWPMGRFLTIDQFTAMTNSPYPFIWVGNIYWVSNWLVLIVSILFTGIAVLAFAFRGSELRNATP